MVREHHYNFAHVALRQIFFHDTVAFVATLSADRLDMLERLWDDVGRTLEEADQDGVRLPSEGLGWMFWTVGEDKTMVIVTLPPPEDMPEAYFVGLVVPQPQEGIGDVLGTHQAISRYFTLEYSTGDGGSHLRYFASGPSGNT